MPASEPSTLQGWLLKQKHGLYRSWLKRYFVLHGRELSYYRNETDKVPQNVLDLDHYTISCKKHSRRNCTFVLVAEEHHMQPDYYLQADSKDELDVWVSHLQQHMSTSSVLDKWLERLDMTCAPSLPPSPSPARQDNQTVSCTSLHVPAHPHHPQLFQQQHQYQHHHHHSSIRSHRSVESMHTFCSLPNVSHRVSFTNDRRPSSQSTHSNSSGSSHLSHASNSTTTTSTMDTSAHYRPSNTDSSLTVSSTSSSRNSTNGNGNGNLFFTSRIFSRKHQQHTTSEPSLDATTLSQDNDYCPVMLSPSSPSLLLATTCSSSSTDAFKKSQEREQGSHMLESVGIKQQQALDNHFFSSSSSTSAHVYPFLATSIIHPSEYNHDDDPQERLRLRQQQLPRGQSCSNFHYPLDSFGLASPTDTSS